MSKTSGSKGRGRNRNNSSKRSSGRSNIHDSQQGRNRGNAQQLLDKYLSLARDSLSQGDRIAAENFFQHADHFQRVISEKNEKLEMRRRSNQHSNVEHNKDNLEKNHRDLNSSKNGEKRNIQDTNDKKTSDRVPPEQNSVNLKDSSPVSRGNVSIDNVTESLPDELGLKGSVTEDQPIGTLNSGIETKE